MPRGVSWAPRVRPRKRRLPLLKNDQQLQHQNQIQARAHVGMRVILIGITAARVPAARPSKPLVLDSDDEADELLNWTAQVKADI